MRKNMVSVRGGEADKKTTKNNNRETELTPPHPHPPQKKNKKKKTKKKKNNNKKKTKNKQTNNNKKQTTGKRSYVQAMVLILFIVVGSPVHAFGLLPSAANTGGQWYRSAPMANNGHQAIEVYDTDR